MHWDLVTTIWEFSSSRKTSKGLIPVFYKELRCTVCRRRPPGPVGTARRRAPGEAAPQLWRQRSASQHNFLWEIRANPTRGNDATGPTVDSFVIKCRV